MTLNPLNPPGFIGKIIADWTDWPKFWDHAINEIMNSPVWGKFGDTLEAYLPRVGAIVFAAWVRMQGEIGKAFGEMVDDVEKVAGPTLIEAAAAGLSDYFGVPISPAEIKLHAGFDGRRELSDKLGALILDSMFGQFDTGSEITPELGKENAEKMIGFNLSTALEGWMGGVLTTGYISKILPSWADLDDIIAQNLGFGRANRRVMGPLLTALIHTPFTWYLNERLKLELLSESQLARALFRDQITEDEYFATMARHGWKREDAAALKVINARLLEKEDIQRGVELGVIKESELLDLFKTMGYPDDLAEVMRLNTINERLRTIFNAFESVARDMFRDGEIEEPEFRAILGQAGRSELETDAVLSLALLERSRVRTDPVKIKRVPRGTMERVYREGLIARSELEAFYLDQGYPERDSAIMMALQDLLRARAIGGAIEAGEESEEGE